MLEIPCDFRSMPFRASSAGQSKKKTVNYHQDSPTTKGRILSWELTSSPPKSTFEDDFPFPEMGYVSSQEGSTHSPPRTVTCGVTRTDTLGGGIVHRALVQVLHTVLLGGPVFRGVVFIPTLVQMFTERKTRFYTTHEPNRLHGYI